MLRLTKNFVVHEGDSPHIYVAPERITAVMDFKGDTFVGVIGQDEGLRVIETPEQVARLRAVWFRRHDEGEETAYAVSLNGTNEFRWEE